MINKENVLKLADFIEAGSHPWNMRDTDRCFFGQFYAMTGGFNPDSPDLSGFLGLESAVAMRNLTMPDDYQATTRYPKERAVKMLRNLAETGKVEWQ